ncbi:MAG TPA: recombinase family protein [Nannocystaceae bacterium]|nr:recombinase family protein [Nannocystaceae bacterium]
MRVSTDEQHLGPDAQRDAIDRWCAAHGVHVAAEFVDRGVSGAAPLDRRPGLLAALDAVRSTGAGLLIVAKRDRLARDIVVAAMIERLAERAGARVVTASGVGNGTAPEDLLLRGIVDVFAQFERAIISSRTRAALAVKRGRGERIGRVPFGFRLGDDGVHLVADDGEQETIAMLSKLRESMSLRAVAEYCLANGIRARDGEWWPSTIQRVLGRPTAEP